jgi:glycosyl transferase family 28
MEKPNKKKILITPLNWGLGHATRCIPIINALIKNNFTPIIASDGEALLLLQKEFPKLISYELPSYNITYPQYSKLFLTHFLFKIPHFFKTLKAENKAIQKIVVSENIVGIISDNRFGCYHPNIKSVYITHQLRVLSGMFTFLTSKMHQKTLQNFDACWVPDDANHTFSGTLSKVSLPNIRTKYMGILSRFKYQKIAIKYDYLILVSGPEPERSRFENLMIDTFKNTSKKVLLVQGKIDSHQKINRQNSIDIYNYMTQNQLQQSISESNVIIARSGYSTVMDLAVMGKKAFFIPTPSQTEQLYLAMNLERQKVAPFALQHQFKKEALHKVDFYNGFTTEANTSEKIEEALAVFKEPFLR